MAAPTRQPVGTDGVEFSAGGEDDDLVGRLRRESELQLIAFLEGQRREIRQMPLHRPQPALFGDDDRHRFLLDHRVVDVGQVVLGRIGEGGAAFAEFGIRAELLAHLLDLPADRLPLLFVRAEQRLDLLLLGGKPVELLADLDFLELAQRAQPHD